MPDKKLVLAYSGGLDTSVAIRWLKDQGWDVIAFTVDLGEKKDLDAIQARALKTGASAAYVADGRLPFLQLFVWPSLQAGAVYEKEYPLATAQGRLRLDARSPPVPRRADVRGDRVQTRRSRGARRQAGLRPRARHHPEQGRRRQRCRPDRSSRESPHRHQVARDLRGAGCRALAPGASGARGHHAAQGSREVQRPGRAAVGPDGLRRPLVQPA